MPTRGELSDIFLMNMGTRELTLVSRDKAIDEDYYRGPARWSPDGKWLAWDGEKELFVSDTAAKSRTVYRLRATDAKYRSYGVAQSGVTWGFAWAPSSDRLAAWQGWDGRTAICRLDGTVEKEIDAPEGAKLMGLCWSPGDALVSAFDLGGGTSAVYRADPDAAAPAWSKIADFAGALYGLECSPDARKVSFVGESEGTCFLYVVGVDGTEPSMIAGPVEGRKSPPWDRYFGRYVGTWPRWSPDGRRLTYGSDWRIYTVGRDGSDLRDVTPPDMSAAFPAWSADGTRIVFQGDTKPPVDGQFWSWQIWLMDADGSNLQQLTNGDYDTYPQWAP